MGEWTGLFNFLEVSKDSVLKGLKVASEVETHVDILLRSMLKQPAALTTQPWRLSIGWVG